MWDLVKGRCTYTVRLESEAEAVHFCQEDGGARYALLCGTLLTLHSVGEAGTLRTLAHPRRALCMAWVPGGRIVSGSEDGSLRLWDTQVCGCCLAPLLLVCDCCAVTRAGGSLVCVVATLLPLPALVSAACWLPLPTLARRLQGRPLRAGFCSMHTPAAPVKETPFTHSTLGLTVQC